MLHPIDPSGAPDLMTARNLPSKCDQKFVSAEFGEPSIEVEPKTSRMSQLDPRPKKKADRPDVCEVFLA